jgi:glucosyl-dolichyl phosphate glucuronosyltransferase
MMQPLITVVICTRNRDKLLEKAVRRVLPQANGNVEILIVDNGSTDNTTETVLKISAADPRVSLCREPQPGLSIARNRALQYAKSDWVIFMDDDAEAGVGWLAAYEEFFRHPPSPKIAAVGGAVIPQYEIPPPKWMKDSEGKLDAGPEPFRFARGDSPWECNCAYRRDAALQIGGFDTRLGHCGDAAGAREGVDLNIRLQDAGYEIWWLPGAVIRHLIHAERLNLRWVLRAAFNQGRCIALQRLNFHPPDAHRLYIARRVLIAPFHCGINLLAALANFPFQNGRAAVKALTRVASIAGLTCEFLRQIFRSRDSNQV